MSRCFAFPPPGYTLSNDKEEFLNKLIKLHKEKQRKKEEKQKKKERKEEKQRKKEEKQKEKQSKEKKEEGKERKKEKKIKPDANLDKSDIVKAYIGQNICSDKKIEPLHKERKAEIEQLERSGLTEEHGHPVCKPVPSSSSDSTENSHKRKRESSPVAEGNLMQNEFDASSKGYLLCTTSGRTDFPAQDVCCTLKGIDKRSGTKSARNAVVTPWQRMELQYRNLLENLVPPQFQDVPLSPENLDWLFKDKNQEIQPEKRQKSGSDSLSCSISWGLWPRAEYLHKVDAYALPYTVPY